MTILDALNQRVRFLRLPPWHDRTHLELPLLEDGGYGPWVILRDYAGESLAEWPHVGLCETHVFIHDLIKDGESRYEPMASREPQKGDDI